MIEGFICLFFYLYTVYIVETIMTSFVTLHICSPVLYWADHRVSYYNSFPMSSLDDRGLVAIRNLVMRVAKTVLPST